jgi:hypothetical protein
MFHPLKYISRVFFVSNRQKKNKRDMITGAKTNRFKRNNKINGKRPNRINKNRQRKMFVLLSRNFIPALFFNSKNEKKRPSFVWFFWVTNKFRRTQVWDQKGENDSGVQFDILNAASAVVV